MFLKSTVKFAFSLITLALVFFVILPHLAKPANAATWSLSVAGVNGTNVSFHIVPNSGNGSALIMTDLPPGGLNGQTIPTNVADFTLSLPTGTHTAVVSFLATTQSNPVNFTVGGSGSDCTAPGNGTYVLGSPTMNGNTATFTISNGSGTVPISSGQNVVLHVINQPDNGSTAGTDSAVNGSSVTWTAPGNGSYCAALTWSAAQISNAVAFSVGGATWNNPGKPPPPFNIMDVFQPAKRFGSFGQLASDVLLILVSLAGALAMIFIMISGFKFVTSSGDEKKLASARATLTYAIIGIAVVILAFVIVQILQYFLQSSVPIT